MKYKFLLLVSFLISVNTQGQKAKTFNSNVKGVEKAVDSLPYFVYSRSSLDSFLINNAQIPIEDEPIGMSVHVYVSFNVDSLSNPTNIDVLKADVDITSMFMEKNALDSVRAYYSRESVRLISLTKDLWVVSNSNFKNQLNIVIPFVMASYEQKKKDQLKPNSYDQSGAPVRYDFYHKNFNGHKGYKIINYYDLGVVQLNSNKYLLAKKYFEQAISFKSDDIDAYYNLGITYHKLNDDSHACTCWKTGQKLGDTGTLNLIKKFCQ